MEQISVSDLTVLLVEPSQTQSKIINHHLALSGVNKVDNFPSAEKAFNYMRQSPPDLVMSSMHLPDSTGRDLILKMREDESLAEVPFVLVSSETAYRYIDPMMQAGVTAILPKPFDQEDLTRCLKSTQAYLSADGEHYGSDFEPDALKCLLVDDSKTARRHFRKLLEKVGIEKISECENGKEAIEALQQDNFDFVVSDYNMPEMNGRELVEYIQNSEFSYIPVLMITSEKDGAKLNAVRHAGVCALFDKTVDVSCLRNTLESSLNIH